MRKPVKAASDRWARNGDGTAATAHAQYYNYYGTPTLIHGRPIIIRDTKRALPVSLGITIIRDMAMRTTTRPIITTGVAISNAKGVLGSLCRRPPLFGQCRSQGERSRLALRPIFTDQFSLATTCSCAPKRAGSDWVSRVEFRHISRPSHRASEIVARAPRQCVINGAEEQG